MSRLGKIARLPRTVRDALNARLQEGEHGPELLAWLNAEPAVQAVLAAHFGGHAVNAQNLSDWRRGGYAAWCQQQEIFELAERLREDQPALEAMATEEELAGYFTQAALLALMRELQTTWSMEEGADRRRTVLALVRAVDRLRRGQATVARASRERAEEARPARAAKRREKGQEAVKESRPAPAAERREAVPEALPPVAPVRQSPPTPGSAPASVREPAPADAAEIEAAWAAAKKLAKTKPRGPFFEAAPFGSPFPALQALQAA